MEISTISETVAKHLRLQIITGKLPSGQKLNEMQLATSLGISRPPLREAFRILENEHLLVSTPRKGTTVRNISIEDLREVYQIREMIECYAIDLLKDKDIKDLSKAETLLREATGLSVPSGDNPEELLHYLEVFADFHVKLIESTGNSLLLHLYRTITLNLKRYQFMHLALPGSGARSLAHHREILSLLKKNGHGKAKNIMKSHINLALKSLEKKIARNKVGQDDLPGKI
jgi:GntR family transcriptional regulator, rspAB operon transcriptional repressor